MLGESLLDGLSARERQKDHEREEVVVPRKRDAPLALQRRESLCSGYSSLHRGNQKVGVVKPNGDKVQQTCIAGGWRYGDACGAQRCRVHSAVPAPNT